jgi:hypothetical protein
LFTRYHFRFTILFRTFGSTSPDGYPTIIMSVVVSQTRPFSATELQLKDPNKWSRGEHGRHSGSFLLHFPFLTGPKTGTYLASLVLEKAP